MLLHIISFLYVNRENEDVTNRMIEMCRETLANIYRLRSVCSMFRDVIDESQTLWRTMVRYTRRSLIQPTPPNMPALSCMKGLKKFIALDEREYKERNTLSIMSDHLQYGCFILHTQRKEMDYSKVVLQRKVGYSGNWRCNNENLMRAYDIRLKNYRNTVKKLDKLCGIGKRAVEKERTKVVVRLMKGYTKELNKRIAKELKQQKTT